MADLREAFELQNVGVKVSSKRNIKNSLFKNLRNWISGLFCCCRKRTKLSPEAQKYLDNPLGVGPVPPQILEELKKYRVVTSCIKVDIS
jgi:hypothetical protein